MSEEIDEQPEFGSAGEDQQVNYFFLACECKPGAPGFAVLDPFVYDTKPGWILGTFGIIHYDPAIYAIVTIDDDVDPIFGYMMTISHPDTVSLLDRMKGYYSEEGFNTHIRKLVLVSFEDGKEELAWAYVLSPQVISSYESIEQVDNGIWDSKDTKLLELEERFFEEEDEEENMEGGDTEEGDTDEPIS